MNPSRWAQNRIDYIVYHNPKGVLKLIDELGYEAPRHPKELALATRELVREEGQKAVLALLALHPDRKAIMAISQPKTEEDTFCAACSHYSFSPEDHFCQACGHNAYDGRSPAEFLAQLTSMPQAELQSYYDNLIHKANLSPENTLLGEEVRMVWNELRLRKAKSSAPAEPKPGGCGCGCKGKKKAPAPSWRLDDPLVLVGIVVAALVVGSALR